MGITDKWSLERETQLRGLWQDGVSFTEIAARMAVSKNSIIGKVHRMGLPSRIHSVGKYARPKPQRKEGETKPRRGVPKGELFRALLERKKTNVFDGGTELTEPEIPDDPGRFVLLQLEDDQCRWASGQDEKGRHLFCGDKKVPGKPYCECHVERSTSKPTQPSGGYHHWRTNARQMSVANVFIPA